jgi:hypothetical protein
MKEGGLGQLFNNVNDNNSMLAHTPMILNSLSRSLGIVHKIQQNKEKMEIFSKHGFAGIDKSVNSLKNYYY